MSHRADDFKTNLEAYFRDFFSRVATKDGDWTVKGFIDIYKNIYTISVDTKVVSKVIELMIFPVIVKFAEDHGYQMILSAHQNHYPDITFVPRKSDLKIALDLKSTYRITPTRVNGMTLGAFTGYFRHRTSTKNITFPYSQYARHFVLGVIYTQTDQYKAEQWFMEQGVALSPALSKKIAKCLRAPSDENFAVLSTSVARRHDLEPAEIRSFLESCLIDERKRHKLQDLSRILSVIRDFDFFVQEKWRIAIDRPGSGNTKNIGSSCVVDELKNGAALFTKYPDGERLFDDYWMYYLAADMARAADLPRSPYANLKSYFAFKGIKAP